MAEEEIKLRQSLKKIKADYEEVKQELLQLRKTGGGSGDGQAQLEELQAEYNKLESRYSSLLEQNKG